jgi:hypothetical protein
MKIFFTTLFFLIVATCSGQNTDAVDSLIKEACSALENSKEMTDSAKMTYINKRYIFPYINSQDEAKRESLSEYINLRTQKLCKSYYQLLERLFKLNQWHKVDHKIESTLSKNDCRSLLKQRNFYYLEENGDTTHLTLDGKFWIDKFKDGTYSKLSFTWKTDCEFEIQFIETNNPKRKAIVNKNEKLSYVILGKYPNRYELLLVFSEQNEFWVTSIYY